MARAAVDRHAPKPKPLPRATCHVCGCDVAVRKAGELREHRPHPSDPRPCPGSGQHAQSAELAGDDRRLGLVDPSPELEPAAETSTSVEVEVERAAPAPAPAKAPPSSPRDLPLLDTCALSIASIRLDGGTQHREMLEELSLGAYAESLSDGDKLPPVVVVVDADSRPWLVDGFHRVEAARRLGHSEIRAELRRGSQRDAILLSCGANAEHGLRRSRGDKRRAVITLLSDPEWSQWSDRAIAEAARVSHQLVGRIRAAFGIPGGDDSTGPGPSRTGRDGRTYDVAGLQARRVELEEGADGRGDRGGDGAGRGGAPGDPAEAEGDGPVERHPALDPAVDVVDDRARGSGSERPARPDGAGEGGGSGPAVPAGGSAGVAAVAGVAADAAVAVEREALEGPDLDAEMLRRRVGWLLVAGRVPVDVAKRELRDALGLKRLAPGQYEAAVERGTARDWWQPSGDLSLLPPPDRSARPRAASAEAAPAPDPILDAALRETAEAAAAELVRDLDPVLEDAETELADPPAELATLDQDVELEAEARALEDEPTEFAEPELPDDERAPFDAYYTPRATARACVRWLDEHVLRHLPPLDQPGSDGWRDPRQVPARAAVEPSVGGGSWVLAVHDLLKGWTIDRVDIDPAAPGLELERWPDEGSLTADWLAPFEKIPGTRPGSVIEHTGGWHPLSRWRWRLCLGNRPYRGDFVGWVERSLERSQVVALLERETITGTVDRARWLRDQRRPSWVVKLAPRPRWEGPGARDTSDFSDSVLIVWVHGHEGPTLFDWILVDDEAEGT